MCVCVCVCVCKQQKIYLPNMKPHKTANIQTRFLFAGDESSRNATKLTAMKTTKHIFMLLIGEFNLLLINFANIEPGMVQSKTSRNTNPLNVPENPSSTRKVTFFWE